MEITCRITELTEDSIRVETVSKKQEIDVFFTKGKKQAIHLLFDPHMVATLNVELQTVESDKLKHAKLWLLYVWFPTLPDCSDFSRPQMERYNKILTLYDQNNLPQKREIFPI